MTRKRFIKKLMAVRVRRYDAESLARKLPKGMSYLDFYHEVFWRLWGHAYKAAIASMTELCTVMSRTSVTAEDLSKALSPIAKAANAPALGSVADPIYIPAPENAGYWR